MCGRKLWKISIEKDHLWMLEWGILSVLYCLISSQFIRRPTLGTENQCGKVNLLSNSVSHWVRKVSSPFFLDQSQYLSAEYFSGLYSNLFLLPPQHLSQNSPVTNVTPLWCVWSFFFSHSLGYIFEEWLFWIEEFRLERQPIAKNPNTLKAQNSREQLVTESNVEWPNLHFHFPWRSSFSSIGDSSQVNHINSLPTSLIHFPK